MAKARTGTIRERQAGRFEIALTLGYKPDGRTQNRKYITIKADSREEAELEMQRMIEDLGDGETPAQNTVSAMLKNWRRNTATRKLWREATKLKYRALINEHILPWMGGRKAAEVRPRDIEGLYTSLGEAGRSASTIAMVHSVINQAFEYWVDVEELEKNPVKKRFKPSTPKPKEVFVPSISQVTEILELAKSEDHPLYAALWLGAYCGMRRGEVMGLRWANVNLAQGFLDVKESLVYAGGSRSEEPKTGSSDRRVKLGTLTVQVLLDHKAAQERRIEASPGYVDQGIVFSNRKGGYRHAATLYEGVRALSGRVGQPFTFHSLRHHHISVLLSKGEEIIRVSKKVGHASIKMTFDRYGHEMPDTEERGDVYEAAMNSGDVVEIVGEAVDQAWAQA